MTTGPDDPRCEWVQTLRFDGREEWIKGACNHLTPVAVENTITGEVVAWLCTDCDQQLPAHWRTTPAP